MHVGPARERPAGEHLQRPATAPTAAGALPVDGRGVLCWTFGLAYTVVYKLATGKAPFPDTPETALLINGRSDVAAPARAPLPRAALRARAGRELARAAAPAPVRFPPVPDPLPVLFRLGASGVETATEGWARVPADVKKALFVGLHSLASYCALHSAWVDALEAELPLQANPWGTPSIMLGVVGGVSTVVPGVLVPKYPIQSPAVNWIGRVTGGTRLVNKMLFSNILEGKLGLGGKLAGRAAFAGMGVADNRTAGALIDMVLVLPALGCTVWHFVELGQLDAGPVRSEAIIEEVSNVVSYAVRVLYFAALVDKVPESKAGLIIAMAAGNVIYAGLQCAEAVVAGVNN